MAELYSLSSVKEVISIALGILAVALIILISLSLSRVSDKIGLPTLAVFIGLGMLFGEDGLLKIQFDDSALVEQICSVSLVLIMFYGGFGTSWEKAKPVAKMSILLSSAGVVLTAVLTGLFCHFLLGFSWLSAFLIGAVISSTDAASVFAILRSRKLNLRYGTASLLEVESGSNDPFAYMLTMVLVSLMNGESGFWPMLLMLGKQLVFGALIGPAVAFAAGWLFNKVHFQDDGYDSVMIVGAAFLSYGISASIGGNGYLSVYLTGIIMGNRPLRGKRSLVHFFDGVTGLMQIMVFFLLGLLSTPSELPLVALPGLLIALFLTLVGRPAAVFALMQPFKCPREQQMLVSWCGLRGASSIVFAITATMMSAYMPGSMLFNIIFFIVLFSIIIQGTLIPLASRKLGMIDSEADVMKTFSDYTDHVPIQYLKLKVDEKHPWANRELKSIQMLPQTRVALIQRGKEELIPRGDTKIEPEDILIVSGPAYDGASSRTLTELRITAKHEWRGLALKDIRMEQTKLIIMIIRGQEAIIPGGDTVLQTDDVLVMNEAGDARLHRSAKDAAPSVHEQGISQSVSAPAGDEAAPPSVQEQPEEKAPGPPVPVPPAEISEPASQQDAGVQEKAE